MSASRDRIRNVQASTLRPPSVSGGKRGEPVAHLSTVCCSRLFPISSEDARRAGLETPLRMFQTHVDSLTDILPGDVLVVDGKQYPVRWHEVWQMGRKLIVEELLNASTP